MLHFSCQNFAFNSRFPVFCSNQRLFEKENKLREEHFSADLKLLELLLGVGVEDVSRVWVCCSELGGLQPVFKTRIVLQELTPETPGLLDPEHNR